MTRCAVRPETVTVAGPDQPTRRDYGGRIALGVVLALAAALTVLSAWRPAPVATPSDDRQPGVDHLTPVADLPFTVVENGVGPVSRDRANGAAGVDDGEPIDIGGQVFERGLGVHAPSWVRLYPDGKCSRFVSYAGVDRSAPEGGSVVFRVVADGIEIYDSGRLVEDSAIRFIDVDLDHVSEVDLIVTDAGDGTTGDMASWADAGLDCQS